MLVANLRIQIIEGHGSSTGRGLSNFPRRYGQKSIFIVSLNLVSNRLMLLLQKKPDLLVAKLRIQLIEGHGSSKFDRNRCRDRQTDDRCLAIKTQFRNWSP